MILAMFQVPGCAGWQGQLSDKITDSLILSIWPSILALKLEVWTICASAETARFETFP